MGDVAEKNLLYGEAKHVLRFQNIDTREYGVLNIAECGDEDLRGRCGRCGHGLCISGSTAGGESIYICRYGCGATVTSALRGNYESVPVVLPNPKPDLPPLLIPIEPEPRTYRVLVLDPAFNTALVKTVEFTRPKLALEHLDMYLNGWVEPKKRGDV